MVGRAYRVEQHDELAAHQEKRLAASLFPSTLAQGLFDCARSRRNNGCDTRVRNLPQKFRHWLVRSFGLLDRRHDVLAPHAVWTLCDHELVELSHSLTFNFGR